MGSNNTNKLSPQELLSIAPFTLSSSNNTNKLSPQERYYAVMQGEVVQIIQINLVLKNKLYINLRNIDVQIIQINLVLKNIIRRL